MIFCNDPCANLLTEDVLLIAKDNYGYFDKIITFEEVHETHFGSHIDQKKNHVVLHRHVSRISLGERPQLRGAPRLGGPEVRGP